MNVSIAAPGLAAAARTLLAEQAQVARLCVVLRALGAGKTWPTGEFRAVIGAVPFPELPYSTACALYECARGMGRAAALTSSTEIIRSSWHPEVSR